MGGEDLAVRVRDREGVGRYTECGSWDREMISEVQGMGESVKGFHRGRGRDEGAPKAGI